MADYPHRTSLCLEYETEAVARTIARSLRQEIGQIEDDRSRTELSRSGRTIEVSILAADLIALRAAANTWLSLVSVCERTVETVDF